MDLKFFILKTVFITVHNVVSIVQKVMIFFFVKRFCLVEHFKSKNTIVIKNRSNIGGKNILSTLFGNKDFISRD